MSALHSESAPRRHRKKSPLIGRLEYGLYRIVAGAASSASDESVLRWGTRLGNLSARLLRGRNRLAMRNVRAAFPEKSALEVQRIVQECWRHFGRASLDYLRLPRMAPETIAARCDVVNREALERLIAMGKGVILISAHYGSWEYGGLVIMTIVDRVTTVVRTLDNAFLDRDLSRLRAQTGAEVVDRRHAARHLVRALNERGVVILLPDQAVLPREGVLTPFLGRPAWTTPVPAKLALKLGSPIVFAFCVPQGSRHRLEFEQPLLIDELGEEQRSPEGLTALINDVISRRITARPEMWLWMHDRWKATGDDEE
jgi:KDO2-lipid IV(A) lauroyltransferase